MAESSTEHLKCSGCDKAVSDLDILIRIKDDVALCDECLEVLVRYVREDLGLARRKAHRRALEAEENVRAAKQQVEAAQIN